MFNFVFDDNRQKSDDANNNGTYLLIMYLWGLGFCSLLFACTMFLIFDGCAIPTNTPIDTVELYLCSMYPVAFKLSLFMSGIFLIPAIFVLFIKKSD